ncbi:melatonin receptor type 1C-like [Protopterus annectens]|uniref:melatonin receptor type 1C-like n=1 Tax=Protopterus annectens TaxID=7888 RepID=UPI001CFADD59|nr:melatonin receptor type 1C-like [Protopterus annectens]
MTDKEAIATNAQITTTEMPSFSSMVDIPSYQGISSRAVSMNLTITEVVEHHLRVNIKTLVNCSNRPLKLMVTYFNTTDFSNNFSESLTILLTSVMIFIAVMDVIGNALVIASVLKNKKLRNAGNVFVINLAVGDLMVGLYTYPLVSVATLYNKWIVGDAQCKISSMIHTLSFYISVYSILGIAINRYCCICYSLSYDKFYSMKSTCCYVLLIWSFSIILLIPGIVFDALQYDERVHFCAIKFTANPTLTGTLAVLHFIIPVIIVIFCYLRIWILVIQVKYRVRQDSKQKLKPAEVRNFITMFAVFVLFAVCWSPFSIPALVVGLNPKGLASELPSWLYIFGYFTASFNSCLNGIVYGVLNQNFRQEYKRILMILFTAVSSR